MKLLAVRQALASSVAKCGLFAQMAQEAQDQRTADAELVLRGSRRRATRPSITVCDRHAAVGVGLRIEEEFGTHDVDRRRHA